MKVDTIISRLEGLESWLKRNGFPGAKPAVMAVHEAIKLLKEKEPVEPTINEYGEVFCGNCGENVGIIPESKNLPAIRSRYCSECGRKVLWKW